MKATLKRCTVVLLALVCAVQAAYTADLPTAGGAQESVASPSCFASLWNWLNASVSDCPLTYRGFTLYGTLDVGYGYDTAGVGFGKWYDKGVFYTVQKTSGAARWSWSPDALNASTLGVKMEEPIGGDWLLIGAAELTYNPFSLLPDNGPKSLADNNLNPPTNQTANGDSSRAGQWDNSLGICGRQQRDLWHADRRTHDFALKRRRHRLRSHPIECVLTDRQFRTVSPLRLP